MEVGDLKMNEEEEEGAEKQTEEDRAIEVDSEEEEEEEPSTELSPIQQRIQALLMEEQQVVQQLSIAKVTLADAQALVQILSNQLMGLQRAKQELQKLVDHNRPKSQQ